MRIAYLTQSYPPMVSGAAISARQTAEAMATLGHTVLVIAASDKEHPYDVYQGNLIVKRLKSFNNPFRVGQRLISNPRKRVTRILKQFQPEAIHVHEPIQMGMIAIEYAKNASVPVALTTHQLPWFVASYLHPAFKPIVEKILWMYARSFLRKYTTLISPTETIAKIIQKETGLKPAVISYGLDNQIFHPPHSLDSKMAARTKLDLPLNIPLLIHVGRLDADKSVDKVILGTAQAIRESEAHLLIVGDGCQKDQLIRLCNDLHIEKRVHFTGFVAPVDLPDIYRAADLFITASEIETQGIVLLEAAASGLPIVAVNATCIPEIVHDQVNGCLVEPGNINACSNAVKVLLNDPKKSCAMGMNGRILAQIHDIQKTWMLHENLYKEMCWKYRRQKTKSLSNQSTVWESFKSWSGLN